MHFPLRLAVRRLASAPGFTTIAVLTLAVSIGINSAIFAMLDQALLRAPASLRPEEIVSIFTASADAGRVFRQFSYGEFSAARSSRDLFADVAAVNFNMVSLGRTETLRRASAFMVSENFFSMMGVAPVAGRFFSPEESAPGAGHRVAIASYDLWRRHGLAQGFVGSAVTINGWPHTVIGVSPEGFSGVSALIAPEVWLPLGLFGHVADAFAEKSSSSLTDPGVFTLNLMGRLRPGLNLEAAQAEVAGFARRLAVGNTEPSDGRREIVLARPFGVSPSPGDPRLLRLLGIFLLGMAAVVLLIACLNLANMLLSRSVSRAPEIALRLALGASRRQIVFQLLTEALMLAFGGGALGLLFSFGASSLLQDVFISLLSQEGFNLTIRLQPDLRAIAATFGFCLVATLAFGLMPALRSARADLVCDLRSPRSGSGSGLRERFFSARHVLLMAQMACSLVLMFTASVFVGTAANASATDGATGFSTGGVILAELDFSLARTPQQEAMRRLRAASARLGELPGVLDVSAATIVPYGNDIEGVRLLPARAALGGLPETGVGGIKSSVTAGYFSTIGVGIVKGRDFRADEAGAPLEGKVCILDEGMATRLFPGEDPIGRRVRDARSPLRESGSEMEVVGVVRRHAHGLEDKARPLPGVYVPLAQEYRARMYLLSRVEERSPTAASEVAGTFRRTLRSLDPDLPVLQLVPFDAFTEENFTLKMMRLGATMFGAFGGFALILATLGVYGVKAHAVASQTREIGVRMALGADRRAVFRLVMSQGIGQLAVSLLLGVLMSLGVARILAALFFQVKAMDPEALAVAAAIVASATLAACLIPAARATAVSPSVSLRAD